MNDIVSVPVIGTAEAGAWLPQWQPIETAPMDGRPMLLAAPRHEDGQTAVGEGYWIPSAQEWWWAGEGPGDYCAEHIETHRTVTHWMPLPKAPSA